MDTYSPKENLSNTEMFGDFAKLRRVSLSGGDLGSGDRVDCGSSGDMVDWGGSEDLRGNWRESGNVGDSGDNRETTC